MDDKGWANEKGESDRWGRLENQSEIGARL